MNMRVKDLIKRLSTMPQDCEVHNLDITIIDTKNRIAYPMFSLPKEQEDKPKEEQVNRIGF